MSAIAVEYREVADLIPYARNSRTHSPEQVGQIAASIKEFGFTNPVLIDGEDGIIAGHGRVMAAQKLGLDQVPCIELKHLTAAQKKAYIIADNKLALNAGWDLDMLRVELVDLGDMQFNVELTGFAHDEIVKLFGDEDDDPSDEPSPEDVQRNLLLVECVNEPELQKLFNEMQERGFECKIMS
jgi:ParB-like chromosome segregation protein Spo0J